VAVVLRASKAGTRIVPAFQKEGRGFKRNRGGEYACMEISMKPFVQLIYANKIKLFLV
jgi:hypothetical protein